MKHVVNEEAKIVQVPAEWEQCCVSRSWHQPADLVTVSFGRTRPMNFRCKPEYSSMSLQGLYDAETYPPQPCRKVAADLFSAAWANTHSITKAQAVGRVKTFLTFVEGAAEDVKFDPALVPVLEKDFEPIFGTTTYWVKHDH